MSDERSREVTEAGEFDKSMLIERIIAVESERIVNKVKNTWFHDYLVEFFMRKQMMHVCSNEIDNYVTLDNYLEVLGNINRYSEITIENENNWQTVSAEIENEVINKNRMANDIAEGTIVLERRVRFNHETANCHNKWPSPLYIEHLISKQFESIKKVSRSRFSYLKLKNELILIEESLHSIYSSVPNLLKDDYEKLEAENSYYRQQLDIKTYRHLGIVNQHNALLKILETIIMKIRQLKNDQIVKKKHIQKLRRKMKKYYNDKKQMRKRLSTNGELIGNWWEMVFKHKAEWHALTFEEKQKVHQQWVKKISTILKQIENLHQSLNALKTNLILHGRHIQVSSRDCKIFKFINENIGFRQCIREEFTDCFTLISWRK